jgi:flagellar basal-body rod modification protein FlgD
MPVNGVTNSSGNSGNSGGSATPLKGMQAADFLNLMIQQLQQQDPLNPTDSNALLTQMSQIGSLQSNTQLQQTLTQMGLQQSIGASGNLIGKMVAGIDASGIKVSGLVTSVKVIDQKVHLELDNAHTLPVNNVTAVTAAGASSLAANASQITDFAKLASNNPTLAQYLNTAASSGESNTTALSSLANLLASLTGK